MTEDKKPQPGEPLPEYSIMWIDKELSVPGDRRKVLAFGVTLVGAPGFKIIHRRGFLGATRCNISGRVGLFDIEKDSGPFVTKVVTHWAEITDPEGRRL